MNDDLENANHRLSQYEKAVTLLKQTNEKLVKEIEILKMQQSHMNPMGSMNSMNYGGMSGLNGMNDVSDFGRTGGGSGAGIGNNNLDFNSLFQNGSNGGNIGGGGSSNLNAFSQLLNPPGSSNSQNQQSQSNSNNNNNSNSLEYLVSHMSLESERKTESESSSETLSSKRVLYEFVKMHDDLPKQFNTMAQNAMLQPDDDEASRFVRVLLESDKHPQFKKDIASIVQKLQRNKR